MILTGKRGSSKDGQLLGFDEDLYTSGNAWLSADQAGLFEGKHHLVDGGRRHAEMALHVGFCRWTSENPGIGVDEGEILALLGGERREGVGRGHDGSREGLSRDTPGGCHDGTLPR